MNAYTLLYYPDFSPEASWLKKVLLFADEVKRIVPRDVKLRDPQDLVILQECIPGCLSIITPETEDVAIDEFELPRLTKAFALLHSPKNKSGQERITFTISRGGDVSVAGNVFLHNAKVAPRILEELEKNKLIIKDFAERMGHEDFFIVNEEASNIIVSRVAANMAARTGLDAITDKPIPFTVNSLNSLGIARVGLSAAPEGAVLQALTSVLVPEAIDSIKAEEYRDLRESHKPIRSAFKQLSAELAQLNRLAYISDGNLLKERVESVAQEFAEEYRRFRKSRHTRRFKRWVPFSIGSLLVATSALHLPAKIAAELLGARVAINFLDRKLRVSPDQARRESTFNMLAGLRKDIIRRAKVKELI